MARSWEAQATDERSRQALDALRANLVSQLSAMTQAGASQWMTQPDVTLVVGQASLLVAPMRVRDGLTPMDALVGIASAEPTAELFDVKEMVGIRTWQDSDVTVEFGHGAGMSEVREKGGPRLIRRHVTYLLGEVTDASRWAQLSGTTTYVDDGSGDDQSTVYTAVLDSIVATFRWTDT